MRGLILTMNRCLMIVLAAGAMLGAADAAEPSDVAKRGAESAARQTTAPAPPEQEPKADGTSAEVFVPTEDISEDLAVAFPVDI